MNFSKRDAGKGNLIQNGTPVIKGVLEQFANVDLLIDLSRLALYPADFSTVRFTSGNSMEDYICDFLSDLNQAVNKVQLNNLKIVTNHISIVSKLFRIRKQEAILLNYDRVWMHLGTQDLSITKFINAVIDKKLNTLDEFKVLADQVSKMIKAYYNTMSISDTMSHMGNFYDLITSKNERVSALELVSMFSDIVVRANSNLMATNLESSTTFDDDTFELYDEDSAISLAKKLTQFFSQGYSFYDSGYPLIDLTNGGFESTTLHIVAAPTNHLKSMLLANICRRVVENNIDHFDKDDVILYCSFEDDQRIFLKRIIPIFGNYNPDSVKKLFQYIAKVMMQLKRNNQPMEFVGKKLYNIFKELLKSSVINLTQNKVTISFMGRPLAKRDICATDIAEQIERQRIKGKNVIAVFCDYIDKMTPSIMSGKSNDSLYINQGLITEELDLLAKKYRVPVITATQCTRDAENPKSTLSKELIADSINKIRFAHSVYMGRIRNDLHPFVDPVKNDVLNRDCYVPGSNSFDHNLMQMMDTLIKKFKVYEFVVVKAKDGDTNLKKYMLFCTENLRIYHNISEYFKDSKKIQVNTAKLEHEIISLLNCGNVTNLTNASDDFDNFANDNQMIS